jgi:hypothetical protein
VRYLRKVAKVEFIPQTSHNQPFLIPFPFPFFRHTATNQISDQLFAGNFIVHHTPPPYRSLLSSHHLTTKMPRIIASELTATEFHTLKSSGSGSSIKEAKEAATETRPTRSASEMDRPIIKISCIDVSLEVGSAKNKKKALTNVNASFGAAKVCRQNFPCHES